MTKTRKLQDTVKCECGKEVAADIAKIDEDCNWYCPQCLEGMGKN